MNYPALCRRCGIELNPSNFGYNPQDVTPNQTFYCWTCGPILEAEHRIQHPDLYVTERQQPQEQGND